MMKSVLLFLLFFLPGTYLGAQTDTALKEPPIPDPTEEYPKYPGGDSAMKTFIAKNMKYPQEALDKRISGSVYISGMVEEDGSLTELIVMKGIGHGCDEEALRIVKLMKLIPGQKNGKPYRVKIIIPVKFKLER